MYSSVEEVSVENFGNVDMQLIKSFISVVGIIKELCNNIICQKDRMFYNVQFKGGQSIGVFIERGLVIDISQCVGICCGDQLCDLVYMEGQWCYIVKCYN